MSAWLFILTFFSDSTQELNALREKYIAAAIDEDQIEILAESCHGPDLPEPTAFGYCSMIHFLTAKNALNPYKKLNAFSKGRKKLDSLISRHSENIELRYLRHSIQDRVPFFLGYHDQLETDKEFMTTKLNSIQDSSTYHLIYNYLQNISE